MAIQTTTVRIARHFQASAKCVFDAWFDSHTAGQWLFATPAGQMLRVEINARIGGGFVFVERRNGEDIEHIGEYLEIERPRRLVFTFVVSKYSSVYTRVTIEIEPSRAGCELTLVHEGVLAEYEKLTQSGWKVILEALSANLVPEVGTD